jgi:hypothetical protein
MNDTHRLDNRTIGERISDQRHLLEFGPSSIRVALELARDMHDARASLGCPDFVSHRTIGAVIHCAELAAGRIEESIDRATGWGEIPD